MNYLIQTCGIIINCPQNSPDLNNIEMMRSLMKNIVAFYHQKNLQELIEAVNIAWPKNTMEIVNRLCNSFIRKCFLALKNLGQCINHLQSKMIEDVIDQEIADLINQLTQNGIVLEKIECI